MARARSLKPTFFSDVVLLDVPPLTRILFSGLWCWSDREGRLADNPKQIKMDILPRDRCDVNKMLVDLQLSGLIKRYQSDGKKYIQVINFLRHQHPHRDEKPSLIPAPSEHRLGTVQAPCEPGNFSGNTPITSNLVTGPSNCNPAPRKTRRGTEAADEALKPIADAVAELTKRPDAPLSEKILQAAIHADHQITPEQVAFVVPLSVREGYPVDSPGLFLSTVPEYLREECWPWLREFFARGPDAVNEAREIIRSRKAPERIMRFMRKFVSEREAGNGNHSEAGAA